MKFSQRAVLPFFGDVYSAYSDKVNPEYIDKVKSVTGNRVDKRKSAFQKKAAPILNNRPLKIDGYYHQLLFPNLTLAIDCGVTFSVQIYQPINPLETKLINYFFLTKLTINSAFEQGIVDILSQSSAQTHLAIFEEDKAICETVQLGISSRDKEGGIFSQEEQRVYEFHNVYMNYMKYVRIQVEDLTESHFLVV